MIPRRVATLACSLAALTVLATACGDDPVAGTAAGSASESTLPSSEGAPTGSGSLTIADATYGFDVDICSLTPVNHDARDYEIYVHGTGESSDGAFEVEVFRTTSDSGNVIEVINMKPGEGELAGATNAITDATPAAFEISSSILTGELDFVGTPLVPTGRGAVSVTCS